MALPPDVLAILDAQREQMDRLKAIREGRLNDRRVAARRQNVMVVDVERRQGERRKGQEDRRATRFSVAQLKEMEEWQ